MKGKYSYEIGTLLAQSQTSAQTESNVVRAPNSVKKDQTSSGTTYGSTTDLQITDTATST